MFNGGDKVGLAGDVGRALRGKGFKVALTTNTNERIQRTVVVGASEKAPEVLFVKTFFKDAVVRADKEKATDHSVDVLVGNKYGGFNKKAKSTYKVKATSVCLPSQVASATRSSAASLRCASAAALDPDPGEPGAEPNQV